MKPTNTLIPLIHGRLTAIFVLLSLMLAAATAQAGLVGNYPLDANTLHLWHFDETNGSLCFDATTNAQDTSMVLSNTPGINAFAAGSDAFFAQIGEPAVLPSYGSSIMTTQSSCFYSPWIQGTPPTGQPYPSAPYTNISYYVNTNTGAFTFECMIKPTANFQVATPVPNPEIFSGDNAGNTTTYSRGWQWRFDCGVPAGGCTMEFNNINCPGTNHDLFAILPNPVNVGQWYHAAVAWTGSAPTNGDPPHVFTMYWTPVNQILTSATVISNFPNAFTFTNATGSGMLNWSPNTLTTGLYPSNSLYGTPFFVVGGSGRNSVSNNVASGAGLPAYIDEARISSCYRHTNELIFNTNIPDVAVTINVQPAASTFLAYGQTLSLLPVFSGTPPIQYQWQQNGVPLPGQTNSSLVISNITFTANGNYQCLATNNTHTYGVVSTNTSVAVVTVGAGLQGLFNTGCDINGNPLDKTAPGSVDPNYTLIQNPDATTIPPHAIVWSDASPVGPIGVLAQNGNSVWIGPEENTGTVAGTYTYQTQFQVDESVPASSVLSGTLVASGPVNGAIVQALLNGVETDIPLSTINAFENPVSFVITNGIEAGSNVLQLTMNCTGPGGGAIGFKMQINGIGQPLPAGLPVINSEPSGETVAYGATAGFSVVALGQPPLSYQWYSNGIAISPASLPSANSSYLNFSATNFNASALDGSGNYDANYQVVVSNASGSVTSSVAGLTISQLYPQLAASPAIGANPMLLFAGASPNFAVTAVSGVPPFSYQWISNGVPLTGITNASYSIQNVSAGALTSVACVVTNQAGSATNSWAVSVTTPTAPYPLAVMASSPIGYWRLNEGPDNGNGDGGTIANDYWGANDGTYTNVVLDQSGYNPDLDTNGTATLFGSTVYVNSDVYSIPTNVNFSTPAGSASSFSVEAWVKGYPQITDAGVISKGYNGGEQFSLDCASDAINANNSAAHSFRFLVRDAAGTAHSVSSGVNPQDDQWHHLVGVCDEANGLVTLYIDSATAGSVAIGTNAGILASTRSLLIGSRPSTAATNVNDWQFSGWIQDVAVYNHALTAAQELNHYYAGGIPATVLVQPTNTTIGQYGTAIFAATVVGTPAVSSQWFDNSGPLPGQTNSTLVLTDLPASAAGDSYYLQVANAYGTNVSQTVSANIVSGLAQIYVNPAAQVFAPPGGMVSLSVTAYGDEPLAYQWQVSDTNAVEWTNLFDTAGITGSTSNQLTIANAKLSNAGSYQVIVSNGSGSVTSSVSLFTVATLPIGFNGVGLGWSAQQSGSFSSTLIANGLLTLTDNGGSEGRSFYFEYPQYVGSFKASFTYQAGGNAAADGCAFVLENDPRGPAILSGGGGTFGISGITPSVELELNLYTGNTQIKGYTVLTNGLTGASGANGNYKVPGNVNIASGDPINISIYYARPTLSLTFTDSVAQTAFSTNLNVGNLTNLVGGTTAYIGFSGTSGGAYAVQTINNFSFISIPVQALQLTASNTAAITWPGVISGYVLQQNTDLTTTNWVNVTNAVSTVNGQNQVVVPVNNTQAFYRLSLQP